MNANNTPEHAAWTDTLACWCLFTPLPLILVCVLVIVLRSIFDGGAL